LQGCHLPPGRVQKELGDEYTVVYQYKRITRSRHICRCAPDLYAPNARTERHQMSAVGRAYRHLGARGGDRSGQYGANTMEHWRG
jgi:hypothetical protein